MLDSEEREPFFVSNAKRTRITSKGYVKKTEVIPAMEPLVRRRSEVSCAGVAIIMERSCSYARNLMAA